MWLADMYAGALAAMGSTVVYRARSASAALDILDSSQIDLIVLDIFLGEYSGIELLHELMSYEDTNTVPVVILSAVHEHEFAMTQERWQHYNVAKYLYKPQTTPSQLRAAVQKVASGVAQ